MMVGVGQAGHSFAMKKSVNPRLSHPGWGITPFWPVGVRRRGDRDTSFA